MILNIAKSDLISKSSFFQLDFDVKLKKNTLYNSLCTPCTIYTANLYNTHSTPCMIHTSNLGQLSLAVRLPKLDLDTNTQSVIYMQKYSLWEKFMCMWSCGPVVMEATNLSAPQRIPVLVGLG